MESLEELREIMTCVVCLDTLSPMAIQCSRGHALCKDCRQDQVRCPSCRKPFLIDKPTLLCQIAAIIGGQCKYEGCRYIRGRRNDDHQMWCGFKPAACKLCSWSGCGKDLLSHVQEAHRDALVLNGSSNLMQKVLHCTNSKRSYIPFTDLKFLIWLQITFLNVDWENRLSVLALQVCLVPDGEIDPNLYFTIDFQSDNRNYIVRNKIQLNTLPKEFPNEKSCVFIPLLVLDNDNRTLRINIVQNLGKKRNYHFNPYTNYNFNKIRNLFMNFKDHLVEITANEVIVLILVFLCCILLSSTKF